MSKGVICSGQVTLDSGNLLFAITNETTLAPNNTIIVPPAPGHTNKLALTSNKTSRAITGSFASPSNPKETIKISGAPLLSQNSAAGYFLDSNQSGAFLLENP